MATLGSPSIFKAYNLICSLFFILKKNRFIEGVAIRAVVVVWWYDGGSGGR